MTRVDNNDGSILVSIEIHAPDVLAPQPLTNPLVHLRQIFRTGGFCSPSRTKESSSGGRMPSHRDSHKGSASRESASPIDQSIHNCLRCEVTSPTRRTSHVSKPMSLATASSTSSEQSFETENSDCAFAVYGYHRDMDLGNYCDGEDVAPGRIVRVLELLFFLLTLYCATLFAVERLHSRVHFQLHPKTS